MSEDKREALLNAVMLKVHGNMTVNYIRMRGLDPEAFYREEKTGKCYSGGALMEAGYPLPVESGEYLAYQIHFIQE